MSWKCFLVKSIRVLPWEPTPGGGRVRKSLMTLPDGREVSWKELPVGAMWHSNMVPDDRDPPVTYEGFIPTWYIKLPNNCVWPIQRPPTDGGNNWTMTGDPPNITCHPSINFKGRYHGWVRYGVVSDDVEGRKFNEDGTPVK